MQRTGLWAARAFCATVFCLALYQFSENTADPDLWGHVLFGQHLLRTGHLMWTEPYSWTAAGHPWINHEVLAEVALGAMHRWLGGAGLLLLKVVVGLLTFGLALAVALRRMNRATRLVAWAFGAVAVVEISFGFAARPQIFSALGLAVEFWLLRQIHQGRRLWSLALPPLLAVWINTHGGALAGIVLLYVTALGTTVQWWIKKSRLPVLSPLLDEECPIGVVTVLWPATALSTAALFLNPWGLGLLRWLVHSVLWFRPQIKEWNPTPFGWNHAAFFACVLLAVAAFLLSRRPRSLWVLGVTAALGIMALRSVRNTPLFCIAALAFVPPHLASVLERFRAQFQRFEALGRETGVQKGIAVALAAFSLGILTATFTLHKQRAWTMEVPRHEYPVAAVRFIRQHSLHGNMLTYFDWGEMCLWELPDTRVSIDGRLDTCYPAKLIAAHWKFYSGEPVDTNVLDIARADYALLPAKLAGAFVLAKKDGWQPVYVDDLAVVLVKNPGQFPKLAGLKLPVEGGPQATRGRTPFPARPSPRLAATH